MHPERSEPRGALRFAIWLSLVAVAVLAISAIAPPRALDANAPLDQFSSARAMAHVQQIAREPHPIGTAANRRVRDYLVEQLKALGAEVRVERTQAITHNGRQIYAGTVENIVATISGTANSRAVMLVSHYDSVPESPGAADAGSGVAGILEVVRALKAAPPLQNDLVILFTDGEEEGLLGAAAFVRDHRDLAQRIGLVMNFEARGSSGPALMFETSDGNGWMIGEFSRAAPYPIGSSLAYAVYKRLPNNTDMTVFKSAGLAGLNFAFNATLENYHTRRDTPENLDPRSLQHLGANALALTRHFGNLRLEANRPPNRIFFNWYGASLVQYEVWIAWVILAAIVALLGVLLLMLRRRGLVRPLCLPAAIVAFVPVLLACAAGALLVWWVVDWTLGSRWTVGDTPANKLVLLGCMAAALALAMATQSWLSSRLGLHTFAFGQLVFCALGTAALTVSLPEASYVLQWPLLFALLAFCAALVTKSSTGSVLAVFIGSLPAILIFAPLMYLLFVALGMNVISVSVLAVLLSFLLAAGSPLFAQIGRQRVITPLLLLCAFGFAAIGRQLSQFGPEHPRRNSIFYSVNADERRAAWISNDDVPDSWTAQFLTDSPSRYSASHFNVGSVRVVLAQRAEAINIEPPSATVLSDSVVATGRVLKLHVMSPRNANMLLLRLGADAKLLGLAVDGQDHAIVNDLEATGQWLFRYNAIPSQGFELELRLASTDAVDCWLGDRSLGLPEIPGFTYAARPADMMATYGSDITLVTRRYRF